MNKLAQAFNNETTTENGAVAFKSSLSANVDLFFTIGARRGASVQKEFTNALLENAETAVRILLWSRDVRGGAGERQHFRDLLVEGLDQLTVEQATNVIKLIPEVGRFDDLMVLAKTTYAETAAKVWTDAIADGNGLAAKWAPRKDKKGARFLRQFVGMTEAQWRKHVVANTNVVEQQMCSGDWHEVNYNHVPSRAMQVYRKAFKRNDSSRMERYLMDLEEGKEGVKVNAGAIFPHTCVAPFLQYYSYYGDQSFTSADRKLFEAQWKALPDFMEGSESSGILPVCDVSGSMTVDKCLPLMVSVGLGLYVAERNRGPFKDVICTFSERPNLVTLKGEGLAARVKEVQQLDWGMNTDFNAVFERILEVGQRNNLTDADMPDTILVFSDMEFDSCGGRRTNYEQYRRQFEANGYTVPKLVFWNLHSRNGTTPVTYKQDGTALVSGFSPSIMTSLLKGVISPEQVMTEAVYTERYSF